MPVKSGSATKHCGYDIQIFNENGQELGPNEEGFVVIKLPLPPGNLLGIWDNEARFKASYSSKFDGFIYLVMAVIKMKIIFYYRKNR
jgi:propionyl-CoA synthetase